MQKRQKDLLRALVGELRARLVGRMSVSEGTSERGNLDRELERLGIAPDGSIRPIEALPGTSFVPRALGGTLILGGASDHERYAYGVAVEQLASLPLSQRLNARSEIIERAAYTWINRLLALRAMEVRGLIDNTLRGEEAYGGISERLFILRETQSERAMGEDGGWWAVIEDVCNEQAKSLPGLFALDDSSAALRPSAGVLAQCIVLVGGQMASFTQEESDATFADPDAIGWAYQFYQEESKANIDAKCKSGGKVVNRSELAAKTQLFTEPYMVQWLLQNSLGRSYHEAYPQSILPANWQYYVQPEQLDTDTYFTLASLTLLDPCMGSGHFLRAAFDLFVEMYREQFPNWNARQIADHILSEHLHGIDLDPRAAQLTALTLYLRAWELVRDEHKQQRRPGMASYTPPTLNLATTPTNLNQGMLERHLKRHPQDELFKPLIEEIFVSLEQAEVLGSLLRPREYLNRAIANLQKLPATQRSLFSSPGEDELCIQIAKMAKNDPAALKNLAMDRVIESFHAEVHNVNDIGAMLFGREAEQGVRLLQLLDRQYAVVATNPPYLGSRYMNPLLKKYAEKHYETGKRDLYSSFMLRCLEFCKHKGRVAMVTMHGWMFLRSFASLRANAPKDINFPKAVGFQGLLQVASIEELVHLGRYAFSEIGNAFVAPLLFVLKFNAPTSSHKIWACRLTAPRPSEEQTNLLLQSTKSSLTSGLVSFSYQKDFLDIPETPIVYWLQARIREILKSPQRINVGKNKIAGVHLGLCTGDNHRFIRYTWETPYNLNRWPFCARAGQYQKWWGLNYSHAAWRIGAAEYSETNGSAVRNSHKYFKDGVTYGLISQGSLGARLFWGDEIFEQASIGVVPIADINSFGLLALLNNRVSTYLMRIITQDIKFNAGYLERMPYERPSNIANIIAERCVELKKFLVSSNPLERSFDANYAFSIQHIKATLINCTILHTLEGILDTQAAHSYNLSLPDISAILDETGTPAGWNPLVVGYDTLPHPVDDLSLFPQLLELLNYLEKQEHINSNAHELARIKANLRMLYEAGPGAKNGEQEESGESSEDDKEEERTASGAHIPVPTETFLEELSVKLQLHPISVYWLLEELRAEGARCKPEEQRLLEDRLSVLVLRLLGHRWPLQIEANEPVPAWAEHSGIIPLVSGTGKVTLAERIRERLREEEDDLGVQKVEALLEELTGWNLDEWLRRRFFSRHVSQFKSRPIAWHLASTPGKATGKGKKSSEGVQRGPVFECMLYYHAGSNNTLARVRNEFVEPLIQLERSKIERSRHEASEEQLFADQDTTSALASERIRELEEFARKLQGIEEQGFACSDLQKLLAEEPLDRWCSDGYFPPTSREELVRNEEAWHVDINDGVRVNIAPLQLADVLASNVLKPVDARKAIADRARWRADERRWVRAGKLPRCGWMDERVPASQKWDELEPQRIAEQHKLEQKRLLLQQGQTVDETDNQADETEEEEVS